MDADRVYFYVLVQGALGKHDGSKVLYCNELGRMKLDVMCFTVFWVILAGGVVMGVFRDCSGGFGGGVALLHSG